MDSESVSLSNQLQLASNLSEDPVELLQGYDSSSSMSELTEKSKNGRVLGKRGRRENGLVTLTIKFIDLLKKAPRQTLDLNEAMSILGV